MTTAKLFARLCGPLMCPLMCLLIPAMPATADNDGWTSVTCSPADLPPEDMFDVVRMVDSFGDGRVRWRPVLGEQNGSCALQLDPTGQRVGRPVSSQEVVGSLRVDYDFVGKPDYEYLQLKMPLEIPRRGLGVGFWIRQPDATFPVRLRVTDKSGETHQFELLASTSSQWQFAVCLLDGASTSWGGDGNRNCDYPCHLDGIVFDRPQRGFIGKGSLWIDDVSLLEARSIEPTLNVETRHSRFGNLYDVGEAVELRLSGENDRIAWMWEDFQGQIICQGTGTGTATIAKCVLPRPGFFACRIELYRQDRLAEVQQFTCAALAGGSESARSDFVGVCSHYGQNNYPLPSMDLMRAYGITQFRDEISWRSCEQRRGEYTMPEHAVAFLQRAAELKMRPLIIYDYSNPLYDHDGFPNTPEAISAFSSYAVNLTRQTQGQVSMFEIWNEWTGRCGMGDRPGDHGPAAYGRLQQATYAAVKKAFPRVEVVGIGGEYGIHCADNIASALAVAGPDAMDAWSIHPYRYPRAPEDSDLVGEVTRISQAVRQSGAKTPAWVTEIGWPTHRTSRGSSEVMQARYCVRTLALLQSTGTVEKTFWYDFKDDGLRRDYNEHNFGLVRHQTYNCAPKPGVVAMSVFIRMTGGAEIQRLDSSGSCCVAWYQRRDRRQVLVAWSATDSVPLRISGPVERVVDMMGADVETSAANQLTPDPLYIVGRNLELKGLGESPSTATGPGSG